MAYDLFLKIDGIAGEATKKGHEGSIEIMSFSWGEAAAEDSATGAAGRVALHDISFVSRTSVASPKLALAAAEGTTLTSATLTEVRANPRGGGELKYLTIKLTDAIISSYSFQGSESNAAVSERFALNFAKIEISYYKVNSQSSPISVVISKLAAD
ncbi:MAG TPA: type VI secretion system tube protein Hcp [Actinomycetes bacterium]|nr:type VI secretion system tube protein Hcp [Actinomycetes bacterium]